MTKLKMLQLKKSKFYKLQILQNLKIQNVTKLKNSKSVKTQNMITQNIKMRQKNPNVTQP